VCGSTIEAGVEIPAAAAKTFGREENGRRRQGMQCHSVLELESFPRKTIFKGLEPLLSFLNVYPKLLESFRGKPFSKVWSYFCRS
jgi:hypothetical protein